jgi:diguanylate cyclase (GGDEF)-like protein
MPLPPQTARTAALAAGAASALLGLAVVLGWHLHLASVIQVHPAFAPMQYNTALGFLLGGVGLLAAQRKRVALACGMAMALLGLLTLFTLVFATDIGLDQLFMQHYITVATSRPGRMAPNTALCFVLNGSALVLAGWGSPLRLRWQGVSLLASLAIGLSFAALMGYIVGLPTAYGWGNLTRMAVHTALGFIVLSLGLIALGAQAPNPERGWRPWALGAIVSTITVTLWQALLQTDASSGHAAEFVLAFGLLMALALARATAYALELRRAASATALALAQLGQEIQERKKAEQQVRQLAFYDMLTQLPNRLLLSERLQQSRAASKRTGHYGAAMFLDMDNFKPLNDTHGHAVGDLLLVEAAKRLLHCVRETDTVARFGGDEFVVVLSELSMDPARSAAQALQVAEKIQAALSEPYLLAATPECLVEHRCTVSIGIALFDATASDTDTMLKQADAAMYEAKDAGRHAIRMHQGN